MFNRLSTLLLGALCALSVSPFAVAQRWTPSVKINGTNYTDRILDFGAQPITETNIGGAKIIIFNQIGGLTPTLAQVLAVSNNAGGLAITNLAYLVGGQAGSLVSLDGGHIKGESGYMTIDWGDRYLHGTNGSYILEWKDLNTFSNSIVTAYGPHLTNAAQLATTNAAGYVRVSTADGVGAEVSTDAFGGGSGGETNSFSTNSEFAATAQVASNLVAGAGITNAVKGVVLVLNGGGTAAISVVGSNEAEYLASRINPVSGSTNMAGHGWDVVDLTNPSYVWSAYKKISAGTTNTADRGVVFVDGPYEGLMTYGGRFNPVTSDMGSHTFVSLTNLPGVLVQQDARYANSPALALVAIGYGGTGLPARVALEVGNLFLVHNPNSGSINNRADIGYVDQTQGGDFRTNSLLSFRQSWLNQIPGLALVKTNGDVHAWFDAHTGQITIGSNSLVSVGLVGTRGPLSVVSVGEVLLPLQGGTGTGAGVWLRTAGDGGFQWNYDDGTYSTANHLILRDGDSGIIPFKLAKGTHLMTVSSNLTVGGTVTAAAATITGTLTAQNVVVSTNITMPYAFLAITNVANYGTYSLTTSYQVITNFHVASSRGISVDAVAGTMTNRVAGTYAIETQMSFEGPATAEEYECALFTNGLEVAEVEWLRSTTSTATGSASCMGVLTLSANTVCQVQWKAASDATTKLHRMQWRMRPQ